jgi:hypothetical protein
MRHVGRTLTAVDGGGTTPGPEERPRVHKASVDCDVVRSRSAQSRMCQRGCGVADSS